MEDAELLASMVGKTIVAAEWIDPRSSGWGPQDEAVITLDDGRKIRFRGWGYDAWGLAVSEDSEQ